MSTNKLTRLKHLIELGNRTKVELNALDKKIQDIVTVGGEPNVIEEIQLNGAKQTVTDKVVNLEITHPEYSIVKDDNSGDFAAIYHLTKDGTNVGTAINIPKDMVVQSGSVVEDPEGQAAGTYIKLVLQNVADPLYINVGSLIEYVTSGSKDTDMVVINVSDDHKVTATITDGSITLAKLNQDVKTHIEDMAYAAKTGANSFTESAVADALSEAKGYADSLATNYEAAGAAADAAAGALAEAKTYADGLNSAMDARVKVVEGKAHEHTNADVLDAITQAKTDAWDAAEDGAVSRVEAILETSYYTSNQIDGMIATDAEVTTALDEVFGTTAEA